jgi:hypothetical protein
MGIFDEFAPSGGLFDEFKAPAPREMTNDEETALRARQTAPQREKFDAELESRRFALNAKNAFEGTSTGILGSEGQRLSTELAIIKRLQNPGRADFNANEEEYANKKMMEILPRIEAYKQKRMSELRDFENLPDWYDNTKDQDTPFFRNVGRMAKSVSGALIGGLPAVENLVPAGRAGTAFKTFMRGAGANAPGGALTDWLAQRIDQELGLKDDIDWAQVIKGGATSAALGGTMHAAGHHGTILPEKPPGLGPSGEALSPNEVRAQELSAKAKAEQDSKVAQAVYDSEQAIHDRDTQQAHDQYAEATRAQGEDLSAAHEEDASQLPGLFDEFKIEPDPLEHIPTPKEEPFRDVPLPTELKPNHGFGPDVDTSGTESPYLSGNLAEQANVDEQAGTHNLELQPNEAMLRQQREAQGIFEPKYPPGTTVRTLDGTHEFDVKRTVPGMNGEGTIYLKTGLDKNGQPTEVRIPESQLVPSEVQGLSAKKQEIRDLILKGEEKKAPAPKVPLGQIKKSQGGSFDIGAFYDGFKKMFGMSDRQKAAFADKVAASYGEFKTVDDLIMHINVNGIKDLGGTDKLRVAGLFNMQNQLAQRLTDNKVVPFVFNHLFDTSRNSEIRMNSYSDTVKDSVTWAKANIADAVKFFREWEQLNVNPALRELRSQLQQKPEAIKAYFKSKGLDSDTVDRMMAFSKVLDDVMDADSASLAKHGRTLSHEPFYFPLGRMGPYHVVVTDDVGAVRFAGGYESLADARKFRDSLQMPEGWSATDVVKTDPSRVINSAMAQALLEGAPDWLQKAAMTSFEKRLEFQRNFELGRSRDNLIGGFIGRDRATGAIRHKLRCLSSTSQPSRIVYASLTT